jgi:hypothetical protein
MHSNIIISTLTGGTVAVADTIQHSQSGEPLIITIIRLLLPAVVSIATSIIHHRIKKKRTKNTTVEN